MSDHYGENEPFTGLRSYPILEKPPCAGDVLRGLFATYGQDTVRVNDEEVPVEKIASIFDDSVLIDIEFMEDR